MNILLTEAGDRILLEDGGFLLIELDWVEEPTSDTAESWTGISSAPANSWTEVTDPTDENWTPVTT